MKKQNGMRAIGLFILFSMLMVSIFVLKGRQRSIDVGIEAESPLGEITASTPIKFSTIISNNKLSGIDFQFGTYKRSSLQGNIEVEVEINEDLILKENIEKSEIKDNSYYPINFPG